MLFSKKNKNLNKFSNKEFIKLNLGCGPDHKPGWVNIDSGEQFGFKGVDIKHDLNKGIPFPKSSVDYIYNEHLIEHLTRPQGVKLLQECYRTLKDGGVLRIACPDLKMIIDDYINDAFHDREWLQKIAKSFQGRNRCELVNISMREWGHRHIYDAEDLKQALEEAGFKGDLVSVCQLSKSEHNELNDLETREDSLIIEATKS